MITFFQHIEEIKRANSITDADHIASIKRWYNQGAKKVRRKLKRQVNQEKIYASLVLNQQDYQLPEYAGLVHAVKYNNPGDEYPLIEVSSNSVWQLMNSNGSQTGVPTHYHITGDDIVSVWPKPSSNVTDGLEVWYSPKQEALTFDDITTGSATVTNGSETVTLDSSIVSASWVGRVFAVTDGTHEYSYKITEYVSNTSFKIENYYAGDSGSGKTYIVGQVVDIPEEALDLVETYVLSKYNSIYRKNQRLAREMMSEFKQEIKELNQDYANPSKSRVVRSHKNMELDTPYPRWWPVDGLS